MTSKRAVSIFEVIGPVMVGPSSSHTAGAARLGRIARAILGVPPQEALIELHGSFAQTGRGHGTDKAIIAGLLDMPPHDERIRSSFEIAKASDLRFEFRTADLGEDAHPNSVRITLRAGDTETQITGASLGGALVEITNILGYDVHFTAEYETLIILAEDRTGTINTITGWLLKHNINVAFFRVERRQRGGQAIMIVEADQHLPDELMGALNTITWIHWVRRINRVED